MSAFLDAECVFNALAGIHFIEMMEWKRPKATKYTAVFYHGSTKGTLCFEIHVTGGKYRVSALYLHNLERLYGVSLAGIVSRCAF